MKTKLVLIASLVGLVHAVAADPAKPELQPAGLSATEIVQIKAQELSRALVQLTLQEVAIQRATPVDNEALALNRAQQSALEQQLVKLAIAPLELEMQRLSAVYFPKHPKLAALREEIEKRKAAITGSK